MLRDIRENKYLMKKIEYIIIPIKDIKKIEYSKSRNSITIASLPLTLSSGSVEKIL